MRLPRPVRVPAPLRAAAGERVLAWSPVEDGWLAGTRGHLVHVPTEGPPVRLAWADVQAADWSQDEATLTVTEVGEFGATRGRRTFRLGEAALLLQLVRERVQASIVLQRHHVVSGKRGVRVVARRHADGTIAWLVEYDEGVDPESPQTVRIVEKALVQARSDVGAEPI